MRQKNPLRERAADCLVRFIIGATVYGLVPSPSVAQDQATLHHAIRVAEDNRATRAGDLELLLQGLFSPDPELQRLAVRALGRLERPALIPAILPLLVASNAGVRAEAANALGQAVFSGDGEDVHGALLGRLDSEPDATVRGVIAQTLGRLPYRLTTSIRETEDALLGASWKEQAAPAETLGPAPAATLVGVARGLESLARRNRSRHQLGDPAVRRLDALARHGLGNETPTTTSVQVRRLATAARMSAASVSAEWVAVALSDPDDQVRRIAAQALGTVAEASVTARALRDPSSSVRYEALKAYGRRVGTPVDCGPIASHLTDSSTHVSMLAIDLMGGHCGMDPSHIEALLAIARELPSRARPWEPSWHRPARALVALAKRAPPLTEPLLPRFAGHENWLVRIYAVRAAAALRSHGRLERLAFDRHDNVREAAIRALVDVAGHAADTAYIAALRRTDYQLLITAASALKATPNAAAAIPALREALRRVTRERRETSRDTRLALIERLVDLRDPALPDVLRPLLTDFDPAIAAQVSEHLSAWSGQPERPAPQPLSPLPFPSTAELASLADSRVTITLRAGGQFVLRLLPSEAPTNAARFARLAGAGFYDGLTFHRVVSNFVIQGGSPGANEYMGDGPYTRDELGIRSHLRGTVGVSTRGRDTGDGQIFINLVDNMRLDHNYTIFAEVLSGMDVVDGILEGATIDKIEVVHE